MSKLPPLNNMHRGDLGENDSCSDRTASTGCIPRESDEDRERLDKDHMTFPCELYEAQAARGRYFVHEQTSEVNSRIRCVTRILAMPGTRTLVADLCIFGLAVCVEGGPGFCQRERADGDQCTTSWNADAKKKRTGKHRHARVGANNASEKMGQSGTWFREVARAMEEQLREDEQELKVWEHKNKAKDVNRMRGLVHENNENEGTTHAQDEIEKLMHHVEQALLSLWQGWHRDDTKGGWVPRRET